MTEDYIDVLLYSHKQYLAILQMLRQETDTIVLVQIDGVNREDELLGSAQQIMEQLDAACVDEWLGTISPDCGAAQYTFKSNQEFFTHLGTYESFFLWEKHPSKPRAGYTQLRMTDFGWDDIAFLDKHRTPLFYTTTHEGAARIHKKYDNPILHAPK